MTWNPETEDQLTELWGEGLSGGQISRIMGLTRNTVIGKAHRMGLSARRASWRVTAPQARRKPVVRETQSKLCAVEPPIDGFLEPAIIPDDGYCKWVEGPTGQKEIKWRYCGKPTGESGQKDRSKPRCAFHTAEMHGRAGRVYTPEQIAAKRRAAAIRRKHGS